MIFGLMGLAELFGLGVHEAGKKLESAANRQIAQDNNDWMYKGSDGKDYLTATGEHIYLLSGPNGPCWYGKGGRVVYDLGKARQNAEMQRYINDEHTTYPQELRNRKNPGACYRDGLWGYNEITGEYNTSFYIKGRRFVDKQTKEIYVIRSYKGFVWYMDLYGKLVRLTDRCNDENWWAWKEGKKTREEAEQVKQEFNSRVLPKPLEDMYIWEYDKWFLQNNRIMSDNEGDR